MPAASYDKRIILWDIGTPNQDYEFQARCHCEAGQPGTGGGRTRVCGLTASCLSSAGSHLLTLDTTSTPLRLCPVAPCPDTYLLAGCEGGCCWDVRLDQPQKRR